MASVITYLDNRDVETAVPKYVTFRCYDYCRYELNWPVWVEKASIAVQRKLFDALCKFAWQYEETNKPAIRQMEESFPELIHAAYAAWDDASKAFQRDYLSTDSAFYDGCYTREEKQEETRRRKAHNAKLINAVLSAKRKYERLQKSQTLLVEAKEKYEIE